MQTKTVIVITHISDNELHRVYADVTAMRQAFESPGLILLLESGADSGSCDGYRFRKMRVRTAV